VDLFLIEKDQLRIRYNKQPREETGGSIDSKLFKKPKVKLYGQCVEIIQKE
jgi:hypothetical protein